MCAQITLKLLTGAVHGYSNQNCRHIQHFCDFFVTKTFKKTEDENFRRFWRQSSESSTQRRFQFAGIGISCARRQVDKLEVPIVAA